MSEQAKIERKALSKRVRFEIFKRDGFRCRYCGTTPDQSVLHVDHVVAVANGGTDDPANLVTACASCNGGKSDKPLGDCVLPLSADPEVLREQIEQVRAFLAAQRELGEARDQVVTDVCDLWESRIGPMSEDMYRRMRGVLATQRYDDVVKAIEIVGARHIASPGCRYLARRAVDQAKYFSGVLRRLRQEGGTS